MAFKHLDDPLDYLYEELPEGEMAEMRKHLAECPQCREEIARVRETVKFYRRDPRPLPPADLTKRTVAAVLGAMQPAAAPAATETEGEPQGEIADPHFENIKTEVRGELRSHKRKWLFHPAWAVAASVVFVFALLYHVSPRRSQWNGGDARMAPPSETAVIRDVAATQERDWSPLPAGEPRTENTPQPAHAPTPVLREAEVWDAPLPAAMAEPVPEFVPAQPPPAAEAPKMRAQLAAPAAPAPPPLSPDAPAPMAVPPDPPLDPEVEDVQAYAEQPTGMLPGETLTADDLEKLDALLDAAPDSGPVIIDLMPGMEPPPLIPRPPEVDTARLVRDFLFLAGLQMGHGEFEEAGITIGLLRKYDPEKAGELDEILAALIVEKEARDLADAQEAEDQPAAGEAAAGAVQGAEMPEGPESETVPDKYFFVPENENKNAEPEPAPETAVQSPAREAEETENIKATETIEEREEAEEPQPAAGNVAAVEVIPPDPQPEAVDAEIASPLVGPAYTAEPPSVPVESAPALDPDPPVAQAADVPKASPDAIPPTLWESSAANSPAPFSSAREPRRRPFTTDPYFRDR